MIPIGPFKVGYSDHGKRRVLTVLAGPHKVEVVKYPSNSSYYVVVDGEDVIGALKGTVRDR